MLTKHKIYLKFQKHPSHASEGTKCISICLDLTPPIPARIQEIIQLVLTKPCQQGHNMYLNLSHSCEDTKFLSTAVNQPHPIPARSQEMHLTMCCPNPSHDSEDTKCISTCVGQTHPIRARIQNVFELVFVNPSHYSKDTKYISRCVHHVIPD